MAGNQNRYLNNIKTIRIVLGVLFGTLLLIDGFIVFKNHNLSNTEIKLLNATDTQIRSLNNISSNLFYVIQDTSFSAGNITSDIEKFSEGSEILTSTFNSLDFDQSVYDVVNQLQPIETEFKSLAEVVVSKRNDAFKNKSLFTTRLKIVTQKYRNQIFTIKELTIKSTSEYHNITFIILLVSMVLMVLLGIAIHFLLFKPVTTVNKQLEEKISSETSQLKSQLENAKTAIENEAVTHSILRIKSAQVLKLQESLELAIAYSNKTQQEKSLIYFNIASDLSEYIKVMSLQQKIMENNISLEGNENWITLTNTISQLNSMAGNYFYQAKNRQTNGNKDEVYLTQLMSEIQVSMKGNNKVTFEQVSDMPTVKTDIELLKRVLKPYFELMSLNGKTSAINYSAKEDGSYCEFKFLGLHESFKEQLSEIENKDLSDYSFEEFKVYMANKVIVERGGKYWMQTEVSDKSVFTIYWPL